MKLIEDLIKRENIVKIILYVLVTLDFLSFNTNNTLDIVYSKRTSDTFTALLTVTIVKTIFEILLTISLIILIFKKKVTPLIFGICM